MKKILLLSLLFVVTIDAKNNLLDDLNISDDLIKEVQAYESKFKENNSSVIDDKNNRIKNEQQILMREREKLNLIISQFNKFSMEAHRMHTYYQRYFGMNPEKYKKALSGYLIELHVKLDTDKFNEAKKIDALNELNPLIQQYIETGTILKKLHNEATEYYTMKDYQNDHYKKARAMHKPLVTAYKAFFTVDDTFHKKVEKIQDALDKDFYLKEKKKGHMFTYIKGMSLQVSKEIVHIIEGKKIKDINASLLNQKLLELRQYYDELKILKKENPNYQTLDMSDQFYDALQAYTVAVKGLSFRVQKKHLYTKQELRSLHNTSAWMVRNSWGEVLDKYNKLVVAYNQCRN